MSDQIDVASRRPALWIILEIQLPRHIHHKLDRCITSLKDALAQNYDSFWLTLSRVDTRDASANKKYPQKRPEVQSRIKYPLKHTKQIPEYENQNKMSILKQIIVYNDISFHIYLMKVGARETSILGKQDSVQWASVKCKAAKQCKVCWE